MYSPSPQTTTNLTNVEATTHQKQVMVYRSNATGSRRCLLNIITTKLTTNSTASVTGAITLLRTLKEKYSTQCEKPYNNGNEHERLRIMKYCGGNKNNSSQ